MSNFSRVSFMIYCLRELVFNSHLLDMSDVPTDKIVNKKSQKAPTINGLKNILLKFLYREGNFNFLCQGRLYSYNVFDLVL